jgi:tetratricopeptide (TPR) repeat protein
MGVIDVDTRSDVYSLGVVLYELLTGETPFDRERLKSATFDEMRRIIREEEPKRPSAMVSTLKAEAQSTIAERRSIDVRKLSDSLTGELDWLVMKTMEKDRGRRYESASDLAVDIERYLKDEPVLACPPSIGYRFNKLARRNRDRLIVGALVGSAILLAAGFAANAKLTQSRENSQLVADVQSSIASAKVSLDSGDLAAAERWIALARGRLGDADHAELETKVDQVEVELKTHQQERERFELFQELARSVLIIDSQKTLQDHSEDLHELFKALNLYSILDDDEWYQQLQHSYLSAQEQEEVKEAAYQMLLVWADNNVRWRTRGRNAKSATKSLDFLRRAELFHEPTRAFYFVRSECYKYLGEEEKKERDLKAYKEAEAVSAFDHFLPAHTASWRGRRQEAIDGYKAALLVEPNHYASLFYLAHRQIHTEPRAAAEIFRACLALRPNHSSALINRAGCLRMLQEYEEALLLMENVHENYRESWFFGNRGEIYLDTHRNQEALADFTKGAVIESEKDYPELELLAKFHRHRAQALERLGEREKCVAAINSAISVLADDSNSEELVRCHSMRAKLHALAGERDRAFVDAARAQQLIRALGSDVSNKCVAYSHNALAWGLVNSSDLSLRNHPRALEEAELTVAALPTISAGWNTLGVAQYRAGDFTAAIASLEKSSELNGQKDVEDLCLDYIFIAMAHHRLNNDKESLEYYDRSLAIREKHGSDSKLDRFFQEAEQLFESETGPANESSTIDK